VGCHHLTVVGVLGHHDHPMVWEHLAGVPEHRPEEQWVSDLASLAHTMLTDGPGRGRTEGTGAAYDPAQYPF
jgi:hypothetical protein